MTSVKIYTIKVTKAYMASLELGTKLSLTPWEHDTSYYEGQDDGGIEYQLPEGYGVAEAQDGSLQIYNPHGEACAIVLHWSGRPQLIDSTHSHPVLEAA